MSVKKTSHSISILTLGSLTLGLIIGLVTLSAPAEAEEMPIRFSAVAVNMSNVGPRGQQRLEMSVERWSTDEERARIMEALKAQNQRRDRQVADTLFSKERVGTIREVQSLSYDLRYSRAFPLEGGGMQIVMATDRPIGFVESQRSSRTLDYNVSLIILELDAEGNGTGQIMAGAELRFDESKNQITIEHFASEPIRLTQVRKR